MATQDSRSARLSIPVSPDDHSDGAHDAVVTLVEYGDYECPHCGEAYPIVKEVQRRLGAKLRFVFRNFPLAQIHPHAQRAAEAAEAAGVQGKFWDMHDALFEHQGALQDERLRAYARGLEMDLTRFDHDLTSHVHAPRVRADFTGGVRSGVNGTPTFFVNGVRHDDAWDLASLTRALERTAEGRVRRA